MKILVVDDHALVREGLRQVLKGLGELTHILEACDGRQALALADAHDDLDLVRLDFHLPDMGGLEAIDALASKHPELPILVLSGTVDPHLVREVLARGAAGFLPKSSSPEVVEAALRLVLAGGRYLPDAVRLLALGEAAPPLPVAANGAGDGHAVLTARQRHVLQLLAQGSPNKQIARELGISPATVKAHVAQVLAALGAGNRTEAVMIARQRGLL